MAASRFLHSLVPAYVIERLYWEQRGMTVQMVVYCEIIYAVTIVILEIPTGVIADRWSRKMMLVLGAMLGCCEFLILLYAREFWHFALVTFLAGIACSSTSGSENALLYDSLASSGRQSEFEKYLGRINALDFGSAMLAALLGSGIAVRWGLEANYWVSVVSTVACLVATLTLQEPRGERVHREQMNPAEYVLQSLRLLRETPIVGLVLLNGMVLGASITYIDEFWQVYLSRLGVPVLYFGGFSAALMLARLPGSALAYGLIVRLGRINSLVVVTAVFVAGTLGVWVFPGIAGAAAMVVVCASSGLLEPVVSGCLHHRVGSQIRATMDSFQSLGLRFVAIALGLGFARVTSVRSIFAGYGFIALVCSAFFLGFVVTVRRFAGSAEVD